MRGGLQHSDPGVAFQASSLQATLLSWGAQDSEGLSGLAELAGTVCTCKADRGSVGVSKAASDNDTQAPR